MNGRRAVIGLCMLCALFISAIAAQGASAKGTTAFTCKAAKSGATVGFSKEHCKREDAVSTGAKFEHVEIAKGTSTELTGTNAKTNKETLVRNRRSSREPSAVSRSNSKRPPSPAPER